MTDLCYMVCVRKLLALRARVFPQFATHNALTVASVIEDAGGVEGYEFQRLHGMGESLYEALIAELPAVACRVYAPVGGHRDLLAYLVRRLLENGATASFVSAAVDFELAPDRRYPAPAAKLDRRACVTRGIRKLRCRAISTSPERRNSMGVEFGDSTSFSNWRWRYVRTGSVAYCYYGGYYPYLYGGFGFNYGYWPSYPYYDYGYSSYPDYSSSYGYPAAYQSSPNVTVVYAPPSSQTPVYVERPNPVVREYDEYGQQTNRPAPSSGAASPIYLIAFRDRTIRAAASYWVESGTLHYVTLDRQQQQAPVDSVDRELSARLNRERRVAFTLPTVQ